MCLTINKNWKYETEEFRKSGSKLIGYKILEEKDDKFYSPFQKIKYLLGETVASDRETVSLTEAEELDHEVNFGIHLYQNIEDYNCDKSQTGICPYLYRRRCPHRCPYPYQYLYRCQSQDLWAKFEIDPQDLVVVGTFDGFNSFVVMKATLVEVIK